MIQMFSNTPRYRSDVHVRGESASSLRLIHFKMFSCIEQTEMHAALPSLGPPQGHTTQFPAELYKCSTCDCAADVLTTAALR